MRPLITLALDKHARTLEQYAEAHTSPPDPHLAALAAETRDQLERSLMLTGVVEGRLLEMLAFGMRPRRVLDVGTYSGYSALTIAPALADGGRIITCEVSDEHADFAQRHFDASPYADRIELRRGPALETIAALPGPFDLVFIDADKENYVNYYEATLPKLSQRGLIVVDNTLWGGRVADERDHGSKTELMREFNARVRNDGRVVSVMLTVRDGVTLIRRAGADSADQAPE